MKSCLIFLACLLHIENWSSFLGHTVFSRSPVHFYTVNILIGLDYTSWTLVNHPDPYIIGTVSQNDPGFEKNPTLKTQLKVFFVKNFHPKLYC